MCGDSSIYSSSPASFSRVWNSCSFLARSCSNGRLFFSGAHKIWIGFQDMFSPFSVRQILWRPISMCRLHKGFVDVVVAVARTLSFHMCLYSSRRGHYNCRKSFRVLAFPIPLFLFGLCATKFSILPRGVRTLCSPNLSSKLAIFSVSRRRACWTIFRVSLEAALQFLLAVAKSVRHSISSLRLRRFSSWTLLQIAHNYIYSEDRICSASKVSCCGHPCFHLSSSFALFRWGAGGGG